MLWRGSSGAACASALALALALAAALGAAWGRQQGHRAGLAQGGAACGAQLEAVKRRLWEYDEKIRDLDEDALNCKAAKRRRQWTVPRD